MKDTYNGFIFNHCFIGFDKTILPTKRKNDFTLSSYPYIRPLKQSQKEGERKIFGKRTIFSFGQHRYNTLHHLQPWRNNQLKNHEHRHWQNAMQYIPYFPQIHLKSALQNDFAQSFSLAFIIRKNALILYSFSEEKEVQNGLFYHFIYKTLVVNWSNMLHREVT